MKTIGTNPPTETSAAPDLIKDNRQPAAAGTEIGELVGGKSAQPNSGMQKFDPTEHEAYWRENHLTQNFAGGKAYEEFHPAYRAGYEGYSQFGHEGKTFEETETKLRERYESEDGSPKLPWTVARPASRAAWHRYSGKGI